MRNRSWVIAIIILLFVSTLACAGNDTATPERGSSNDSGEPDEIISKVDPTATAPSEATEEPTAEPTDEATKPPTSGQADLEVINDSDDTITIVYISSIDSDVWGESWLDGEIAPGESRLFENIEAGSYDLQVRDEEDSIETLYGATLDDSHTWTVIGTASVPDNAVLRFEDDFSDNRNSWGDSATDDVTYNPPTDGEYCMEIRTDQMTAWEWYEPFRPDDFLAEVKCTVDVGTDAVCGLGFGPDGDNLFWYEIDAESQSYAVFLLQNDEWQPAMVEWTGDLHIDPTGQNYLGLGRIEGTLYVYVNGTLIDSVDTDLFPTGRIGIGGASYDDPDITVCLDNLRVWRME
jgi:hypothetical protein